MTRNLAWMDDALCAQTDPDLFHPEGKGPTYRDARALCTACPVRLECETYVQGFEGDVSYSYRHGLWAGELPKTRANTAKDAA